MCCRLLGWGWAVAGDRKGFSWIESYEWTFVPSCGCGLCNRYLKEESLRWDKNEHKKTSLGLCAPLRHPCERFSPHFPAPNHPQQQETHNSGWGVQGRSTAHTCSSYLALPSSDHLLHCPSIPGKVPFCPS